MRVLSDVSFFAKFSVIGFLCICMVYLIVLSLLQALKTSNYGAEPMLRNCGISISSGFTDVEGRVLQAPRVNFLPL